MNSGTSSFSFSKPPIRGASFLPRLASPRSGSGSSGCFQLDLAWRISNRVFIDPALHQKLIPELIIQHCRAVSLYSLGKEFYLKPLKINKGAFTKTQLRISWG